MGVVQIGGSRVRVDALTRSSAAAILVHGIANKALGALLLGLLTACDSQPSTGPTPQTMETPTKKLNADVTGTWQGGLSLISNEYDTAPITLTLTQTGTEVMGTFECLYRCVHAEGTISGTIDGTRLTARIDFPGGGCETLEGRISPEGFFSGTYACNSPIGRDGAGRGQWSAARDASSLCVPELLSPKNGEFLDNGRTDFRDPITWEFDWTDCPGERYHLLVIGPDAIYPVVDTWYGIDESRFQHVDCGYVGRQNGWRWRVRTFDRGGRVGRWSREGLFNVEPIGSDPPADCSGRSVLH